MSEPQPFHLLARPAIPEPPLRRYEANVTSQCGEDGVIAHALEVIGNRDRWCCEFGAWDGRHASNTWALREQQGYRAVLVEGDAERFAELQQVCGGRDGVTAVHAMVGFAGPSRLDALLAATPIPHDFDLLSIDVDGTDYHVWEALREYRPKLVVVEYNPTIPNEVEFVQARDASVAQGASLAALARLAALKGYRLIHATVVNGIFVDEQYFFRFGIADPAPAALRADVSQVSWLFQTYDGRLHVAGYPRARWHGVPLDSRRLQVVPRLFRGFPADYARWRSALYRLWRLARRRG